MALYRVLETSFINSNIYNPGDTVEYDGEVAGNLELVKKGKAKAEEPVVDTPVEEPLA